MDVRVFYGIIFIGFLIYWALTGFEPLGNEGWFMLGACVVILLIIFGGGFGSGKV